MSKVSQSVEINATPEACFEFIADPLRAPLFLSSLHTITPVEIEPKGMGNKWAWEYDMFGVPLRGNAECVEYTPGSKYVWKSTTGLNSTFTYTFEAVEGGTKVSVEVSYELPDEALSGKITDRVVIEKLNEHEAENAMRNLKVVLEAA